MKRGVADLAGMGLADADPKLIGRNIHVMLSPLPVNKRKPKFISLDDAEPEHDDSESGEPEPDHGA
jgi:translation initiation factor IF-3